MNKVQSVDRIFLLIETVAESKEIGISDIARKTSLPKSTVHRLVTALVAKNYLQKSENDRYKLGFKFIAIAGDYVSSLDIRTMANPFLHNLSKTLGVTSHLALLRKDTAIYIEKIQPYSNVCMYSEIGKGIGLYCSALGKSLLLGYTEKDKNNYINKLEITQHTKTTLSKEELVEELRKSESTQITLDNAEHEEGIYCIATPIYNYAGKIIAAISISTPSVKILHEERFRTELINAGNKLSALFGKNI